MTDQKMTQRAFTAILEHFVARGRAPHYSELAAALDVGVQEAREIQLAAVEASPIASCWLAHDTDHIESWAPFSNVPTQYFISVDGVQKWYGQCGMEVLAVRWLFPGQEVVVDTRCLDCGDSIHVRARDEQILEIEPESSVGYMPSPFARSRAGSGAFN
ncbi:MAG: organomercurial lyase [Acidimicrobiia bacterium]